MNQEGGSGTVNFAELCESKFQVSQLFKPQVVQFISPKNKKIVSGNQCEKFKFRIFFINTILLINE